MALQEILEEINLGKITRENQTIQNCSYHSIVRYMRAGTLLIPTVTPKNKVPTDTARFCVH